MAITHVDVDSGLLGEAVRVVVAQPVEPAAQHVPWVWLLHAAAALAPPRLR